ncbi:hypothetical protein ACHAWF_011522 [Thalassiosira exigua]
MNRAASLGGSRTCLSCASTTPLPGLPTADPLAPGPSLVHALAFEASVILSAFHEASKPGKRAASTPPPRRGAVANREREWRLGAATRRDLYDPSPANEVSFRPVVYVSLLNSVVNVVRPDSAIIWQARVPRALWEICIAVVAKSASASNPSVCLLLCLMMLPTALMDIFVWAPGFAMFASFETCTGGGLLSRHPKVCTSDYGKGIGRLFVSVLP